jgi:hypothetical protein
MKATFEIQWLKEHRPNRQRPAQTLEVEELRIGSGAKADVRIGDRLVAGLALKLRPALGGLSIEPIDLFAGAFLNGVPVAGHEVLEPGGALQIGQALLELKVPEPAKFVLSVDEGYLDHAVRRLSLDATTKESATLEHDGPPEASWGKDPVLVRSMAGAIGLALVLSLWLGVAGGGWRGSLAAAHADAKTAEGLPLGGEDGCFACHDSSTSSKKYRCAECHQDQVTANSSHPPASAPAEKTKECVECHREHKGRKTLLWDAVHVTLADARREPLLPGPLPGNVCAKCHDAVLPARKLSEVVPARDRPRPVADVALQFESFSHAKHLHPSAVFVQGTTYTCATCHQGRSADGLGFATVTYESCLNCHKGWQLGDRKHGRDSGVCADCHEKTGEKGLKTTAAAPAPVRFAFEPQDHPVTKEACAACHVSGKVGSERRVAGAPFRHDHHLPVFPDSKLDEESARTQCARCHANVRDSKSLADLSKSGRLDVDLAACSKCHKGNATVAPPDAQAGSDGGAGSGPRADIVHRSHAGGARGTANTEVLARGCFACHVLAQDGVTMGVGPKARACADCHADHQRISCAACHRDLDRPSAPGAPPRCEKSVIDAKEAVVAKRGGVEKFDHFSPNHGALACDTCHAGVDTTSRLKSVSLPTTTMESCVRCHAIARFHR